MTTWPNGIEAENYLRSQGALQEWGRLTECADEIKLMRDKIENLEAYVEMLKRELTEANMRLRPIIAKLEGR